MRYRAVGICLLAGATLCLAVPGVAQAAQTVTNTNDSGPGSLRAAIAAATDGDTISFAASLNGGEITLTSGPLMIAHSLTISGPGAGMLKINGDGSDPVFDIDIVPPASTSVTISGLTITGGHASEIGGGGISATSVGTLTLDGDVITGNQATNSDTNGSYGGGGVFVNGGTVNVSDSAITNNTLSFIDLVVGANGDSGGGGLYSNGGDVNVTGSDVSHNSLELGSNSGENGGGGIFSNGGLVNVATSTVLSNSARVDFSQGGNDGGGGIYSNGGAITLGNSTIDGNSFGGSGEDGGGGGVYANGGQVAIGFSSIDNNSDSGGHGGGGLVSQGGDIRVGFSSISNNSVNVEGSGVGGGAILDEGGQANVYAASTFSGNAVTISGGGGDHGGGAILSFGSTVISNLTIAGNRVTTTDNTPTFGGAIFSNGTVEFKNTIVAGNSANAGVNCVGSGFTSDGFNLESANTCGFSAAGDLVNTDPLLGPLQNNGGPTLTQALPPGSPAVDAGSCTDSANQQLTTDQRGIPVPQPAGGRCDIGAYELIPSSQPPPPPPPPSPSKPAAVPGKPAATDTTGAGFSGSVNPEGQATTVVFQYGIDARFRPGGATGIVYDQSTRPQTLPADSADHVVTAAVAGLVPNALYHMRLVATNATGTTFGPDQTFTTPADPPPPPPTLGKAVNATPVSGKVFLLVAGKLVPLTEADQLPSGTVVDTRHGSLRLTTASSQKHKRQTGTFGGAIFKITQSHSGLTTLSLVENAFPGAPSFASCGAKGVHAAAVSKKVLQLLHASAKGQFRTKGRYAAATVRGTKWTIADRCDGTLTHDITDSVVVTDFVRHRTIVLHHGRSYLAAAVVPKKKKKP